MPLGLQGFIQIGLVHRHDSYKLDVSAVQFFFVVVLNLNIFNQFNRLQIQHSSAKSSRQQFFKHMAVCISVEFQNFDSQKVHFSKT